MKQIKNKVSILIVDDYIDNRLAIKIALKKEGYILYEAKNGQEALEQCIELMPDVILMDAIMPVMDGYESTKAIRNIEEFSRIPILMITALSEKDDKIKALEMGVNDFISKPFDKHELIARCKSYANLSKINKQYILASKNDSTNLPNKSALLDNIKCCFNPKLILFKIEDYEFLEEFYTEEVASKIEVEFAKNIPDLLPNGCRDGILHHISEGEFAILVDDAQNKITPIVAYGNCLKLFKNARKSKISVDNYEYDISIVISFAHDTDYLFEYARVGLNHIIKERLNVIYANEIIDKVHQEAHNNIKIIKLIKIALEKEKVVSYYQPIYNNFTKEIEKYESLVRIVDEDGKVISPFFFLDISKKGRYYTQITSCVIQNSFNALKKTDKEISINLSAIDIENAAIAKQIIEFLEENKKDANRVVFELLEDEAFNDFNTVSDFITTVKSYGVKIAIDDFGTGHSNFERLLDFQPDILKIDGSLIKNIHENNFSRTIVETIQSFATKMNIKTVAEFVSCKEIFDIINDIGIDYTQGYYIDEPRDSIK